MSKKRYKRLHKLLHYHCESCDEDITKKVDGRIARCPKCNSHVLSYLGESYNR